MKTMPILYINAFEAFRGWFNLFKVTQIVRNRARIHTQAADWFWNPNSEFCCYQKQSVFGSKHPTTPHWSIFTLRNGKSWERRRLGVLFRIPNKGTINSYCYFRFYISYTNIFTTVNFVRKRSTWREKNLTPLQLPKKLLGGFHLLLLWFYK